MRATRVAARRTPAPPRSAPPRPRPCPRARGAPTAVPPPDTALGAVAGGSGAEGGTTAAAATAGGAAPKLADLELLPVIDQQGFITAPGGATPAVLAIYSDARVLQLVAFSANATASLITLAGRRPDKAFYFRARHLPAVDRDAMVAIRDAWFEEQGGAPVGNKLALERDAWTQPTSAGAISERGRRAAAEQAAEAVLAALRARGCAEDLAADEDLLDQGKVDIVPAAAVDPAARAAARAAAAARQAAARRVPLPGCTPAFFDVTTDRAFQTNGGMMYDVRVAYDAVETEHRVVVGRRFFEDRGAPPEAALDAALGFLLACRVPMRPEDGMTEVAGFNPGYFSVSEIEQGFPAFTEWLEAADLAPTGGDGAWRFNKVFDYGDGEVAEPKWGGLKEEEGVVVV